MSCHAVYAVTLIAANKVAAVLGTGLFSSIDLMSTLMASSAITAFIPWSWLVPSSACHSLDPEVRGDPMKQVGWP